MFWWLAGAVVVTMLAFSWWRNGHAKPMILRRSSSARRGVDEARAQQYIRDINRELGPNGGL